MPTATLVRMGGRTVLVDAGLGAARAACAQGVALTEIDLVLVTHLHSDHYLELGPLLHTAWTAGLRRAVPVIGPVGLSEYWARFLDAMAFDVETRMADEGRPPLAPLADIRTMEPGTVWDDELRVEAVRNHHPPVADSFALRLTDGAGSVVLSGDTAPFDRWAAFCEGADLLVHEAMLTGGVETLLRSYHDPDGRLRAHILRSHTDAEDVGRLAAAAGVGALALNHFVPDGLLGTEPAVWEAMVRRHWNGPLHLGRDGLRIALPGG